MVLRSQDIPKAPRQRSWRQWLVTILCTYTIDTATDDKDPKTRGRGGKSYQLGLSKIRIPVEHATELGEGYA